jgi:hypothetical protein
MATTTFDNLITFSRGSNATVTGPNGLIQWAPSNLLTNSQDFEAAGWSKTNATIAANATASPDGSVTADTLVEDTTSGAHGVSSPNATVALGPVTWSVFVKAGTRSWVWINAFAGANNRTWFNLADGTVGTMGAGATASITSAGDGWYRCSVTLTSGTATVSMGINAASADNTTGYVGVTSAAAIYIWGAQLELGSTATTYNNTSVRNLLGFSEAFDNAAWTKGGSSIVTGAQANPINGLFNAQKLMEDTATSLHRLIVAATVTAIPYTMSVYAKAAERTWVAVGNTSDGQLAHFNLANGTIGTLAGGATAAITNVGSGWYRCAVTFTPTAGSRTLAIWLASADNTLTYAGNGNSGVYIYGAQLSNSASLDPYVPTPGAAPSSTAYYGPRFDYDPVTLLPRGLLVEEARTNLFTYSDQFDNAAWLKTDLTVTPNAAVSPDGILNADALVENTANSTHFVYRVSAGTAGTYTYSFYAKANGRTEVQIEQESGGNSRFTLSGAGTALALGANTVSITAVGNGWYRCVTTFTATGAFGVYNLLYNGARSYLGNGTSGVFIYGAQLEAGAFATSYIPTIASTVTRSADVATITGSLFSQWYNQNEGGLIAEISSFGIGSNLPTFVNVSDGTTSNYIRFNSASGYLARNFVTSGGSTVANITVGAGLVANTPIKAAVVYANNSFNVAASGATGTEDTSGAVPVAQNQMVMGNWFTSAGTFLNGHIRSIRYVPVRAADFQLQQVTT